MSAIYRAYMPNSDTPASVERKGRDWIATPSERPMTTRSWSQASRVAHVVDWRREILPMTPEELPEGYPPAVGTLIDLSDVQSWCNDDGEKVSPPEGELVGEVVGYTMDMGTYDLYVRLPAGITVEIIPRVKFARTRKDPQMAAFEKFLSAGPG